MELQKATLESILSDIGRSAPRLSGSTTALIAAQLGGAMAKMALVISGKQGGDNAQTIERLDSIAKDLKQATEKDRIASKSLIDAYRQRPGKPGLRRILGDATREPLAAAHLLVELMEVLAVASASVKSSVGSDFFGGAELISAAFQCVMMSVESNVRHDEADDLQIRTFSARSTLRTRHRNSAEMLRAEAERIGLC
ncbi:cyclodeaminase/cyclohydrolase family protein [Rhizobium leguminosarum]|uniref:cyclodeaminase/cyclohydrolase family protein n=1 Tax=Rhizobium leguminosarum TaxID=384 RepID=UPI001C9015F7|nr:cyclodeaminase/cyclohydrolase family protein [Rhizobium leguminosarum]MBY3136959.1 cyclodeaminase/cyclohydrolase family protein [Rhizobium laguerreae]MBY5580870.1 cyclodeaminase/cyclohydrolase family protein [Rhizobium leguminosarum]MBY5587105.1 cyclodeaminase/cyclohydrolase family protein [Rhizobium leguminosarum]MBY5601995.1 cyclodeaminase/cyclohydrolase family protein [Rhizobium leguminosarum]MBY5650183.1 cyclodeaminase/cyclohydrolase family protein [Rhizobium leguminosarum]